MRAYLEELGVFDEILETRAGGVISSHCGPGTLGVLYIAKIVKHAPLFIKLHSIVFHLAL